MNYTTQSPVIPYKTKPFDHQFKAFDMSRDMRDYGLLMEMGTGKSKVFIDTAVYLYTTGQIDAVLLLAPKGVYRNWQDNELPRHFPTEHVPCMWTYWSSTAKPELQASWKNLKAFNGLKWFNMNIEALAYEKGAEFAMAYASHYKGRILIGIDESTMIKNMSSKRTKMAIRLGKYASHRRIMTGDAAPQAPTDLYAQCMFLNPNLLGFSSFYAFRSRYCVLREMKLGPGRTFMSIVGYQRLEELQQKIKAFTFRVTKDECLDLPPKIYKTYDVELTPEQKKVYSDMKSLCVAVLNGQVVTAELAITQILRLHQIVCGHIKDDSGTVHRIPDNRMNALMEVLEEVSSKVIIWAHYVVNIQDIVAELKKKYGDEAVVHYYGGTSDEERVYAMNAFQNNPKVRYFVGNPATGRYGLTLTASPTVIYYSNSYPLEHRTQSEDRAHRIGQESKVTYIDLVCRGTVDQKIIEALRAKKQISALVMGDQWKEWIK